MCDQLDLKRLPDGTWEASTPHFPAAIEDAKILAKSLGETIEFRWNGVLVKVAPDSNLDRFPQDFDRAQLGLIDVVGPYPHDPLTQEEIDQYMAARQQRHYA